MSLFDKKFCSKGEVITKQGSPFLNLYLIRHGAFEILYTQKQNFYSDFDLNFFLTLNNKERFTSNRVFELKNSYNKFDELKVKINLSFQI